MLAAIKSLKNRGSGNIVVAVPTAHMNTIKLVAHLVHRLFCANIREGNSFAFAAAYKKWTDDD